MKKEVHGSERGDLPRAFAATHGRYRTPGAAVAIAGVVVAVCLLSNDPGHEALNTGTAAAAGLLVYLACRRWPQGVAA